MSLEVSDFLEQVRNISTHDLLIARSARLAGAGEMRIAVLRWAMGFKDAMSDEMRDALLDAMDAAVPNEQARQGEAEPTYWDEKRKDRAEEFKREDAENAERAMPDREWSRK
jgi:hypothetical protein